jgi:hypothetical protein
MTTKNAHKPQIIILMAIAFLVVIRRIPLRGYMTLGF